MNTTKVICHAPFTINCLHHGKRPLGSGSYEYVTSPDPDLRDDGMLYLEVRTPINSYDCRVRMAAMNALFEAIKELGVTIEFGDYGKPSESSSCEPLPIKYTYRSDGVTSQGTR